MKQRETENQWGGLEFTEHPPTHTHTHRGTRTHMHTQMVKEGNKVRHMDPNDYKPFKQTTSGDFTRLGIFDAKTEK